jgi:hypothetical protein
LVGHLGLNDIVNFVVQPHSVSLLQQKRDCWVCPRYSMLVMSIVAIG